MSSQKDASCFRRRRHRELQIQFSSKTQRSRPEAIGHSFVGNEEFHQSLRGNGESKWRAFEATGNKRSRM